MRPRSAKTARTVIPSTIAALVRTTAVSPNGTSSGLHPAAAHSLPPALSAHPFEMLPPARLHTPLVVRGARTTGTARGARGVARYRTVPLPPGLARRPRVSSTDLNAGRCGPRDPRGSLEQWHGNHTVTSRHWATTRSNPNRPVTIRGSFCLPAQTGNGGRGVGRQASLFAYRTRGS